eukprot:8560-Eustigmatos_ZCMA.PRE.1
MASSVPSSSSQAPAAQCCQSVDVACTRYSTRATSAVLLLLLQRPKSPVSSRIMGRGAVATGVALAGLCLAS